MDDIPSYYTERPAYPRPPPPGHRTYPPPNGMRMGPPPYGRPPLGPPLGLPRMVPPRSASPGSRMGPQRSQSPGPRMGPGPYGGPMGGPMGPRPREPGSFGQMDMPRGPMPMGGQRMGPPMGALPQRPESPFRAGPPPQGMVPAPLNFRRSPPPQETRRPSPPMGSINSPTMGGMKPLDSIGAPRLRSPSPNPNAMIRSLDSIGAPRPPRSASARPAAPLRTGSPNLLAPNWDGHNHARSRSADDYGRMDEVPPPVAPLKVFERLPQSKLELLSPKNMTADLLPTTTMYRSASPQPLAPCPPVARPGTVSPHMPCQGDIAFGAEFLEEITVGPYQDLDHPPPLPRKNSVPNVVSSILVPKTLPLPQRQPYIPANLPPTPEDESPLANNRGLGSMWLGDLQAGPYADEDDAPPMPILPLKPNRSLSRSPELHTPDMSEPSSDAEDNCDDHNLPSMFAGLRIKTESELSQTLSSDVHNPQDRDSATSSYAPTTPGDNRDSYATDIVDPEINIDESSPIAEEESDLPIRAPRKHVPSMHEYMSMDQLEEMWANDNSFGSFGGSGYFSFDPIPIAVNEGTRGGTPF